MAGNKNFLDGFQEQHRELLKLVDSFRKAVDASNPDKAKKIISEIDDIAERHFAFEQTYLYPRIRRLVREMTERLQGEQEILRSFVVESRKALNGGRFKKDKISAGLSKLPDVSKSLNECDELVFIARKFDKHDEDDLERRFREICQTARQRRV